MGPLIACLVLHLTIATASGGQQTAPPSRDTSPTAQKGTAVMRGKVVAADNGRPLRRARVTLTGIGLGPEARRMTSTGLDGAFVFKDLAAARYRVTVTRGGYLQLEYGQRRPGEQGRPIQVADGQTLDKIDFTMRRMSGIAGRITDENGEPIEGVAVYAARSLFF